MVRLQKQKLELKRLRSSANVARQEARAAELNSIFIRNKVKPILSSRTDLPAPTLKTRTVPRIAALPEAYLTSGTDHRASQLGTLNETQVAKSTTRPPASPITRTPWHQSPVLSVRGALHVKKRSRALGVVGASAYRPRSRIRRSAILPSSVDVLKDIRMLRQILEKDVVFVALDTEFERCGLMQHVVEIGISVLRTKRIVGVDPGPYGNNWLSLTEHHHIVVDTTRSPRHRMRSSRFGESQFLSTHAAKSAIVQIFQSLAATAGEKTRLCFVGHSFESDLAALERCPGLRTDLVELCNTSIPGLHVEAIVDTLRLGGSAKGSGVYFPNLQLGVMTRCLGIDPVHFDEYNSLLGTHNALNDATYSLIATLLMAINWDVYYRGGPPKQLLPSRKTMLREKSTKLGQERRGLRTELSKGRTWSERVASIFEKGVKSLFPRVDTYLPEKWKP